MNMESPVRICLGAALVVNLLLLSGTPANGSALPPDTTPTTVKDERAPRHDRVNNTWTVRNKPTSPDISINELKPKDSTSEEHTDKNAKYKDRGRVRYFSQPKETSESLIRIGSAEAPRLMIVTPTPETKKPIDIIDSMHTFKKTKLPVTSSTPVTVSKDESEEEAYEDEEDEEDTESFEKFASTKFDNFFSMPSYNYGNDFTHDSDNESSNNKVNKNEYSSPSYGGFSRLFPGEASYGYKDTTHDVFKSESFFSFDSDLTTPKNDYFDKKFQRISTSILKNLDTIKVTAPPANTSTTNVHKIVKENIDMEKVGNNTPSNRSTVFIKNTKEIRLLDNDGASSANKELSDVQGTSIYYEMSVLSTETYAIHSDDDCDDSLLAEPTVSTSSEEELATLKSTKQQAPITTIPTFNDSDVNVVKPTLSDLSPKIIKQTSPKSNPEISTKSTLIARVKSTPVYESKTVKPKLNTIRTTSSDEKLDKVKTTSSSMRRASARLKSATQRVVSTKSTLSKFESVKPTLSDSSAESAKPIISNLRFETAKPTAYNKLQDTIPNLIFDTTVNPTFPSPTFEALKPTYPDPNMENVSIFSTNILPVSSVLPIFNTINSIPVSTQNIILPTEQTLKPFLNSSTRNKSYSKRLNLTASKDSPNNVTPKTVVSSPTNLRNYTRKFYHSTPRNKPTWMMPRRNVTKSYVKPTHPTTIYSEHFSMKDKYKKLTTVQPRLPYKTVLTTISSDIDPVLETDVVGKKKIVQSQSIADNTIPSIRKRGSTRFGTSTSSSTEVDTEEAWQIPPTSAVWALASMRSPPPSPNATTNATKSPHKSGDENELQKVENVSDKKLATTASSIATTANLISNDIVDKKVTEVVPNKLPGQPTLTLRTPSSETFTEAQNEVNPETLEAESNISAQSSADPATTDATSAQHQNESWGPITTETDNTNKNEYTNKNVPSMNSTTITRFESITKLPSGVTTPQDETVASSEVNQTVSDRKPLTTTSYPVTTIRFSYVPTEEIETETQPVDIIPTTWHPVYPTRTRVTPTKDTPVTTYRPKYTTTTETIDESTTIIPETTSRLEVSSQVLENSAKLLPVTTEMNVVTTTILPTTTDINIQPTTTEITFESTTVEASTQPTTITIATEPITTRLTTQPTTTQAAKTIPNTTQAPTTLLTTTDEVEDTTTIVVQVVTEINTEKEQIITSTTQPESVETPPNELFNTDCTEESSGNNEIVTDEAFLTTTTKATTTTVRMATTEAPTPMPSYRTSTEIIEDSTRTPEAATTTEFITESPETTQPNAKIIDTTLPETTTDMNYVTKSVSELEDLTSYAGEVTTKASSVTMKEEDTSSGAGVAIAVSTIGVIALILLIGLLLVVRRRGRRGVYAQRCTPVSLDAYSLDSVSVGHRKGNHRLRASKRSYGNPAYDDEVTSHPMQYAALANFALDIESMTSEFAEIPSVSVRPEEVPPGCEDKNRYSNVLPLPETRVPLKRIGNDPTTEYINANYVTGPGNIRNYYIACQAPLSNTVVDFWRMIWEQNSRLVVMLTEYMENGVEKCYEYLPPSEISDNKRTFGEFKIILKKREQRDKYAISSVQLINLATRTWREVTHLWYFWPAKGVPDDYDSIIDFLCEMRSYMKISQTAKEYDEEGVEVIYGDQSRSSFNNLSKLREDGGLGRSMNVYSPARAEEQMRRTVSNNGTLGRLKAASEAEGIRPCVVTCASGAGRSAALIALDVCARALAAGGAGGAGGADVPRVVRQLRAQRPHSLTNRHHYIFVYKVLSEYGNKMLGGGVDTI